MFCYLLAYFDRRRLGRSAAAVGIALLAYALASPWIPPSTVGAISQNAQHIVGSYPLGALQLGCGAFVIAGAVLLCALLRRGRGSPQLQVSLLFLLIVGAITLTWAFAGVYLVPQPSRYYLELEMALAPVVVFGIAGLGARLPRPARAAGAAVCLLLVAIQIANYRGYARRALRPADIGASVEHQAARWLQENLPGARLFATGSTQFWLNAFSDSPQLGGGFQQGVGNPLIHDVNFGVPFTFRDGEDVAKWLRSFGVEAIVVSGPRSRDAYRNYRDPDKFRDVLPELWREGDDVIYAVPGGSPSLARVMRRRHVVDRPPIYGVDIGPVEAFDAALDEADLPAARLRWRSPHQITVTADLEPSHLLSIQVSHHPGWRASVEGAATPVRRDGLGLIVVAPECAGPCTVELDYDGGVEMRTARLARGLALLGGAAWLVAGKLARKRPGSGEKVDV